MVDFKNNIDEINRRIGEAQAKGGFSDPVKLIAVTKYQTVELANAAISAGITDIGENHVQALKQRETELYPCRKHFIGHLQTNKVRQLLTVKDLVLIQSVDSLHLAAELEKRACETDRSFDILVQVNIAHEQSKFGVGGEDAKELVKRISEFGHLHIKGLMSIQPIDADIISYKQMYELFSEIKTQNYENVDMDILSMGMSGDFETAVMCGSNMIRIGTYLFSEH